MSRKQVSVRRSSLLIDDTWALGALAWLAKNHRRAIAALVLLSLACFLPGISSIPPVDRDEARFVQATKQMVETGNYLDIRLGKEARYKKPVGIYWLQAALVRLTGHGAEAPIWVYRLVSLFGAGAAVLLTYWAALGLFERRAAFVAAASLALSLVLTSEAHLAKTDAVLLATVVLAMGSLARLYLWQGAGRAPLAWALTFWIGLGFGILVKGPIAVMVAGLTIAALLVVDRRLSWLARLRPVIGLPVMLAIVLPWFVAILTIAGGEFLLQSVGTDLLAKIATGQEGHGAPPGAHFLAFWIAFWPGAALAPFAVSWVWQHRHRPSVRFCLAWIVPSWLVFEAVATKLPHYTLPTYPAIAALIGAAVAAGGLRAWPRWSRLAAVPPATVAIILVVAATIGLWWLEGVVSPALTVLALVVAVLAIAAVAATWREAPFAASGLIAAATVASYGAVLGVAVPRFDSVHLSTRLAAAVARTAECAKPEVVAAGYNEPSLIFLVGTGVRFADGAAAAEFLAEGGCRVALISAPRETAFLARAAEGDLAVAKHATVEGINIGKLGRVTILVYGPAAGAAS